MGEKKFKIQHWHIVAVMLMVYDTIVVNFAYAVALWLRFDCRFSAIDIKYLAHKYVQTNMAVPWHP